MYEIAAPAVLVSKTGRRPMRSDQRPSMGAKTNCIREKVDMRAPISQPLALKDLPYIGSRGMTMPKPMRSMKTVRKMMPTDGFLMGALKAAGGGRALFDLQHAASLWQLGRQ